MPPSQQKQLNLRTTQLLLVTWLLLLTAMSQAADFKIQNHVCRAAGDSILLDAAIDFDFSDKALEALQNGVPLTLEVHLQVRRDGAWVWEKDLLDTRMRYQIRYHALASVYQVKDFQTGTQESFVTREVAISALGDIQGLPVLARSQLKEGKKYKVELRAALDVDALPLPLRPMAYLSPAWNQSSEWSSCLIHR